MRGAEVERWWWAGLLGVALVVVGCSGQTNDDKPESVVRAWLDMMQRGDRAAAVQLLSKPAKENLQERARRASAATGRALPPEDMLVPQRFALRFEPRQLKARIAGDRAVVEAVGLDPATDRASVPCVREDGRWRVDLVLPPLPEIERRPDAG